MSMSVGKPPTSGSPTTSGVLMLCWPVGIELGFLRERWKASSHDKGTRPPRDSAASHARRDAQEVRVGSTPGRKRHVGQAVDGGRTYATKDFLFSFD